MVDGTVRVDGTLAIRLLHPDCKINDKRGDLPGRAWYVLGWIGRNITHTDGSVDLQVARALFTNEDSPYRICGRRQWNKVKKRGMGVLWNEGGGRLYLEGKAQVCVNLDIEYVEGREVEVALADLLRNMPAVRATFMAADIAGRKEPAPIARKTRKEKTGIGKPTQRKRERLAGVKVERNTAVAGDYSEYTLSRVRYHYGKAAYHRKADNKICYAMPNVYRSPENMVQVEGKQSRRLNRKIKRLAHLADGSVTCRHRRLYFVDEDAGRKPKKARRPDYQVGESYHLLSAGLWRVELPDSIFS